MARASLPAAFDPSESGGGVFKTFSLLDIQAGVSVFGSSMAGKHMDSGTLARLQTRTRRVKALVRCAFVLFAVSLGFVVVAMAVPQYRILKEIELKVADAEERKQAALAERDHRRIELQALREDPAFLEIHARDRLDMCREGERVLRFRRDP